MAGLGWSGAVVAVLVVGLAARGEGQDKGGAAPYATSLTRWTAASGGFKAWQRTGLSLGPDGALHLLPSRATGEATSPVIPSRFPLTRAIPSWNADAPGASALRPALRARIGTRWTRWYSLGTWSADQAHRHSVKEAADADGGVDTDTLELKAGAEAYQLRLSLDADGDARPSVRGAAVAASTTPSLPETLQPGDPKRWGKVLPVAQCSQMVYKDGGEVWCSPTSTAMVLKFWGKDEGACEPAVRAAVAAVYDPVYEGHGNWPFNTAYAATKGHDAYVARFTSFAQAEPWITAGVPVIMSIGWKEGELDGAPVKSSNGHLVLLVGFDAKGNPVINDPAASADDLVRRPYDRAQLERLWLSRSGGTVYLVHPAGLSVPATGW